MGRDLRRAFAAVAWAQGRRRPACAVAAASAEQRQRPSRRRYGEGGEVLQLGCGNACGTRISLSAFLHVFPPLRPPLDSLGTPLNLSTTYWE